MVAAVPAKRALVPDPVPTRKVQAPRDAGVIVRVRSPAALWPTLDELVPAVGGVHQMFSTDPVAVAQILLGRTLASVIDLSQPIDFVKIGLNSKEQAAVSLALVGLGPARSALADDFVIERRDGALALTPRDKTRGIGQVPADYACEIRAAHGAAAYRLICAPRNALPRYGLWLASELAAQPLPNGADVWTEMPRMKKFSLPAPSSAEDELGDYFAQQLLGDIHRVGLGFVVRKDFLGVTLDVGVGKPGSVLQTEVLGRPGNAHPLPRTFFRLPADTSLAVYSAGADPARVRAQAGAFWRKLSPVLAKELRPADRALAQSWLSKLLFTGGPSLFAYGFDAGAARKVLAHVLAKHSPKRAALTRAVDALQGWAIVELDEPAARWRKGVLALNTIPFGKTPDADVESSDSTTTLVPIRAAEQLPKGSLHLHTRTYPNPKYKPKPHEKPIIPYTSEYYLVPDGQRTWMIWAATPRIAVEKLHVVLHGKRAQTLARRNDLAALSSGQGNMMGFATPAAVTSLSLSSDSQSDVELARYFLEALGALPEHGSEPLPFVVDSTADPAHGSDYSIEASVAVTRSNLDEIVALAMAADAHK